jgi:hypothetical protein
MKSRILQVCLLLSALLSFCGASHAQSASAFPYAKPVPNDTTTGTTQFTLTKINSSGNAVIMTSTNTNGYSGVCVSSCGKVGTAWIAFDGLVPLVMENTTTADHYVLIGSTTAGDGHDCGATTYPASGGDVVGRVQAGAAASGTAMVDLRAEDRADSTSGEGSAFPVTVTGGVSGGIPCFTSTTLEAASALLASDGLLFGGGAGVCPAAAAGITSDGSHTIALGVNGASSGTIVLKGSTSSSTTLSATPGGTLNLGSTSATVDGSGNLIVTSCTGCSSGIASFVVSVEFIPQLSCEDPLIAPTVICACGAAEIPAPLYSTEATRYICRRCCAKIQRERNRRSRSTFNGLVLAALGGDVKSGPDQESQKTRCLTLRRPEC